MMKKLHRTALTVGVLVALAMAAVLLLPATGSTAAGKRAPLFGGVVAAPLAQFESPGGGGGAATPGTTPLTEAEATATAQAAATALADAGATQTSVARTAEAAPLTGSAAATATALARGVGVPPPPETIPQTGQPANLLQYVIVSVLLAIGLIALGLWLRRRRAHKLE